MNLTLEQLQFANRWLLGASTASQPDSWTCLSRAALVLWGCLHYLLTYTDVLHSSVSPAQVCPWTLFLTMSLTLLKGLMPHVPQMLPFLITDPEMRSRAEETFMSPEFQENIEEYFVQNIKVRENTKVVYEISRVFSIFGEYASRLPLLDNLVKCREVP